jgi:hypothetical protein
MYIRNIAIVAMVSPMAFRDVAQARYLQPDQLGVLGMTNDPALLIDPRMKPFRMSQQRMMMSPILPSYPGYPHPITYNNLYGYANQNPVMYIDKDGNWVEYVGVALTLAGLWMWYDTMMKCRMQQEFQTQQAEAKGQCPLPPRNCAQEGFGFLDLSGWGDPEGAAASAAQGAAGANNIGE